ncbi:MAG: N-glycosylase/DNA lyase [Candidatus Aenigmarchaeota archaeon]|nr:N-glycosylase/DNA lyase [Candidatus Aenigmarchaeota archaeon]
MGVKKLLLAYGKRKKDIKKRLMDFRETGKDKEKTRLEMFFCLCTPQSKALSCWSAISEMKEKGLLDNGSKGEISKLISSKGVRFKNNKARYIIEARGKFADVWNVLNAKKPQEAREWLVENINGYGYKEASHFMRNSGYRELAILDRHILKNLEKLGVIDSVPKALTKKNYFEIENRFREFSEKTGIPMDELDLLFWAEEAGLIFK